jgi:hypothetical protein
LLPESRRLLWQGILIRVDEAETGQLSEALMAPFPESATSGWIVGLAIAVALVSGMVIVRHWPRRHG